MSASNYFLEWRKLFMKLCPLDITSIEERLVFLGQLMEKAGVAFITDKPGVLLGFITSPPHSDYAFALPYDVAENTGIITNIGDVP